MYIFLLSRDGAEEACKAHNLEVDGSKPSLALVTSVAEWSNAPDLRSGSFGSAGSNPARCNNSFVFFIYPVSSVGRAQDFYIVRYPVVQGSSP